MFPKRQKKPQPSAAYVLALYMLLNAAMQIRNFPTIRELSPLVDGKLPPAVTIIW